MLYGKLFVFLDTCSATSWVHITPRARCAGRTSRMNAGGLPRASLTSESTMSVWSAAYIKHWAGRQTEMSLALAALDKLVEDLHMAP
jgi:hypothetical protein